MHKSLVGYMRGGANAGRSKTSRNGVLEWPDALHPSARRSASKSCVPVRADVPERGDHMYMYTCARIYVSLHEPERRLY